MTDMEITGFQAVLLMCACFAIISVVAMIVSIIVYCKIEKAIKETIKYIEKEESE